MKYPLGENERGSIASKTGKKLDDITLDAVKRGEIAKSRHASFLSLYEVLKKKTKW